MVGKGNVADTKISNTGPTLKPLLKSSKLGGHT
jgi:hypothetical protein